MPGWFAAAWIVFRLCVVHGAGGEQAAAGGAAGAALQPGLVSPRECKAAIYREGEGGREVSRPICLRAGPHLLVDDFLVESRSNVTRRVMCPRRDPGIPNPVVTGKEDGCFQPYMTVLRDGAAGRFRLWYNSRTEDLNKGRSHFGYLESEDGIRWLRPHRVLVDPAPIQYGVSVLDEGRDYSPAEQRFKAVWYHDTGLKIGVSCDGLKWVTLAPAVVLRHSHDVNSFFWDPLRRRYAAIVSFGMEGPTWKGSRRVTAESVSADGLTWSNPWLVLTPVDGKDEGETQFYAMDGFLVRGDLILGMVKVLRDDLKADTPPNPPSAYGMGYTTLAWTRDGEHWVRDQTKFFDRDPNAGAWDHAHAWIDEQVPVAEQVYLYYAGYKRGHKVNVFEERQIGLLRIQRDRYVAREARPERGTLRTPVVKLQATSLSLNANAPNGEARVEVQDENGRPLKGFSLEDCEPVKGDGLDLTVRWRKPLATLRNQPVRLLFSLKNAQLFAFELKSK